jgi:hypothetical protein
MGVLEDTRIPVAVEPQEEDSEASSEGDGLSAVISRAEAAIQFVFPPKTKCLDFDVQAQQQSNWCWLAVATSVDRFFQSSSTLTQCQLANTMLGETTCCANGSTSQCNQPGGTDDALTQVGHFQSNTQGSISWFSLRMEIGLFQDPIVVRIKWGSAAVGHAVILSGYFTDSDGEHWLLVKDPSGGTTALWTYDEFRTAYKGNGTWDVTRRTKD